MNHRFSTRLAVRWKDVDSFGIVNNAVYSTLIEQARFEYFGHLDLLPGGNFPFVVGSTSLRFLRPARAGMELEVGVRVNRLGSKSLDMDYVIRHGDELLVAADAGLVWVDRSTLQSIEIPDAARQQIAAFEGIDAGPTSTR
ncbi:MAG: acyl-CoA thioesterase [Planctomycetes bacterium]|nr:acyl-CoA thioesterase [Planctomycetota bacterium]